MNRTEHVLEQGQALVRAIEALETTTERVTLAPSEDPSIWKTAIEGCG